MCWRCQCEDRAARKLHAGQVGARRLGVPFVVHSGMGLLRGVLLPAICVALGARRHGARTDRGVRIIGAGRELADRPLLLYVFDLRDRVRGELRPLRRQIRRPRRARASRRWRDPVRHRQRSGGRMPAGYSRARDPLSPSPARSIWQPMDFRRATLRQQSASLNVSACLAVRRASLRSHR